MLTGIMGLFPKNFVEIIETGNNNNKVEQKGSSPFGGVKLPSATEQQQPPPPTVVKPLEEPKPQQQEREKLEALFDYDAEEADELTFAAGDLISVINKNDNGWWEGEVGGRRGLFPVNFTKIHAAT